jgi:spoIIIJ-associated protein
VAHAEASAKSVDAAVTAAAAQLGLRSDQVDIEVLEDPVPSTFGYIGTPARVRVTPRPGSSSDASSTPPTAPPSVSPTASPAGAGPVSAAKEDVGEGMDSTSANAGAVGKQADRTPVSPGPAGDPVDPASSGTGPPGDPSAPGPAATQASDPLDTSSPAPAPTAPAASPPRPASVSDPASTWPSTLDPLSASDPALTSGPFPVPDSDPTVSISLDVAQRANDSNPSNHPDDPDSPAGAGVGTGPGIGSAGGQDSGAGSGSGARSADVDSSVSPGVGSVAKAGSDELTPSIVTPETAPVATSSTAQPSSSTASPGGNGDRGSGRETTRASSALSTPPAASPHPGLESPSTTRPPRRTYRDEPIEPEMVEADTERAGDFLEGLLDALDVDGDITTWVDEVGGHIDLEGSDLDVLVGSNGETLDALQELTRLAVLRQSKRRVRLLLDVNGFRARHREQLITFVKATAEQVIRTREDHEFQPMSPAERKIVHDAVAAIEGAWTESLGEDPHRRVVIRPT